MSNVSMLSMLKPNSDPIENEKMSVSSDISRSNSAKNDVLQNPIGPEKPILHGQHGHAQSPSLSQESTTSKELHEIVQSLTYDEHGNNLGYFDKGKWVLKFILEPRQSRYHCSEDQAEQMLQALIEDGMIEEFKPRRYRPTQKLSESVGD